MKYITRTVWLLSGISMLTDIASEMLYPIMPIYLKSIGFSVLLIGILEGLAEATAGISKGYFGKLSDHTRRRVPFIQLGYTLSALSKPMLAAFVYPVWIFLARSIDRLGKGIRTGARDALLSDEATAETKGRVFGFHRSMDTLGAVAGPALTLVYLQVYPARYRTLFLIAFLPGLLAIFLSALLKDKKRNSAKTKIALPFFSFMRYWKQSPILYKRVVVGLLVFTLCNSSDVFLLLKIKQAGLSDGWTIGLYIFYNVIFALASYPLGVLADKIGLKKIFIAGLCLFAGVYAGMTLSGSIYFYGSLFFLYGLYAATTDGISKAWISNISSPADTATAIGTYTGFQSLCTMLASSITGWLWFQFGPGPAFLSTAIIALLVTVYFLVGIPNPVADSRKNG